LKIQKALLVSQLCFLLLIACTEKQDHPQSGLSEVQQVQQVGLDYLQQNKLDEAAQEFTRLIELAPEEVSGYSNLGIVYLRQGNFSEAEKYLEQALALDPENITVRLNLYELYQQTDQQQLAEAQLESVLELDPDNLFALYQMSERAQVGVGTTMTSFSDYLVRIIDAAPTNIVPRLYLIEYQLENKKYQEAREQLEEIQSKFERLPEGTQEQFALSYKELLDSNQEEAYAAFLTFHNQLKLTNWYQADIRALRGSEYSQIGIPLISFSQKMVGFGSEGANQAYQSISFNEVAENAGLKSIASRPMDEIQSSFVLVGDLDNDGDQDLLQGVNQQEGGIGLMLYRNELGRFEEIIASSGIENQDDLVNAALADYDNDGFLDLFLIYSDHVKLYHNVDEMTYQDVTEEASLGEISNGKIPLFFDADHDGDLDLFVGTAGHDRIFRNNGDGSFLDISAPAGIAGTNSMTNDAVIGDFDDDGDIDLFVANSNGDKLFSNTRMGAFRDITSETGLSVQNGSLAVSSGDFNNDGFSDLLISSASGKIELYQNQGKAQFENIPELNDVMASQQLQVQAHKLFDYDNDGFLDIVLAGTSLNGSSQSMMLLRNQQYSFENRSESLPQNIEPVHSLAIGDYNEDSDLDIFVTHRNGAMGLLRNDGGNMNYQLKVQLIGLRQGSGKNNYFGIGSKVELRSGSLYQMRTVTSPNEYFGLGSSERADVLRIRWTNGVPQNIFAPHSDRDLIEQQRLKGSCPFLYTWNGKEYTFVKDIMWRSALGMPLGIMTSDHSRAYAYPDASREYIKIPGSMLKPENQQYLLKITGELWETIYLDQLKLFAIDHPDSMEFQLDEKFVMPPFPGLHPYFYQQRQYPKAVTDGQLDLLDKVRRKDNVYISEFANDQFQGVTELKDLVIDLGEKGSTEDLHLFMNGWIFPSDASINVAISQSDGIEVIPPYLQVLNEKGQWQTVIENLGFPMGKNKTVVTDLSDVFITNDRQIRIRTSMQIYWDHIYYGYVDKEFSGNATILEVKEADLEYRGFSADYRKGGRFGPHWFDYQNVTTEPRWMDLEGYYTRYGDVRSLLDNPDNQYVIYNAGDEVSITYSADNLPELPKGWIRDFVIYSVGWVKDGDLNTAHGQTVEPLPFHGMSSYPYPEQEHYPFRANQEYIKKYNTRFVDQSPYRDYLKSPN